MCDEERIGGALNGEDLHFKIQNNPTNLLN